MHNDRKKKYKIHGLLKKLLCSHHRVQITEFKTQGSRAQKANFAVIEMNV